MEELERILRAYASRYPAMQPQDAVKLVYQNEFGGGHIISDEVASFRYFQEEVALVEPDGAMPMAEPLGNGMCRLNLSALKARGDSVELLNRLFIAGAGSARGGVESFEGKLGRLLALTEEGAMPFTIRSFREYLDAYQQEGYPVVRHSSQYREAYHPAYRVLPSLYVDFLPLFSAIDEMLGQRGRAVIAIDGRCGSGKTALANLLAEVFDCAVIRMDDFFLPQELRTPSRLMEAGGNIHYERFLDEVLAGIRGGGPFRYRVFDCTKVDYAAQQVEVEPRKLTVVEGSYSLHPQLASIFDLKVFMTCSPQTQHQRILTRNGQDMLKRFIREWIPMEERYFAQYGIMESCDLVFVTDEKENCNDSE